MSISTRLRGTLVEFIEEELASLVTDVEGSEAVPTAAFQRVIQRAAIHVQSSGRNEVTGANVLVAIFAERESNAAYFLQEQDMTRYDAVNFIAHGVAKNSQFSEERPVTGAEDDQSEQAKGDDKAKETALGKYCVDLNKKAREGDVDPLIGRGPRWSAASRCCAAAARTTRFWWGIRALARPRLPKGWPRKSSKGIPRMCCPARPSSRSTWARCWQAHATAAISRSA